MREGRKCARPQGRKRASPQQAYGCDGSAVLATVSGCGRTVVATVSGCAVVAAAVIALCTVLKALTAVVHDAQVGAHLCGDPVNPGNDLGCISRPADVWVHQVPCGGAQVVVLQPH